MILILYKSLIIKQDYMEIVFADLEIVRKERLTNAVNGVIMLLTEVVNNEKRGLRLIDKFMSLEEEKRERIINAAMEEFAKKGYQNASTNEIVKNAGISKGLLFHYFSSKKNLFLFLLDYSSNKFIDEFYSRIDCEETDIIKRWRQIAQLKIELIQKHPDIYQFIMTSYADDSAEIRQEIEERNKSITQDAYKKLLTNIDTSVYKDGLDVKRVSEIIIWVTQGFGNSELEKLKKIPEYKSNFDVNAIMADYDEYMKMLITAFYK